uniref:Terpene synthase n=1 Tax=Camellia sinensis TaxID=4442 RepID=A0A167V6G3_CAMSI|nr:terpene synthase [Camellia sinensis]
MDCSKGMLADQQHVLQCQRRSANYKSNIWKYDLLQSLTTQYNEEDYKRQVEKLEEEVMCMFMEAVDLVTKLEFIDNIEKLGLANLFEMEIKEALDTIVAFKNNYPITEEGLYANALFFRLLRQHGFNISQDIFRGFTSKMGTFNKTTNCDTKAMLELLEASHLALEGENILIEAKASSTGILKNITNSKNVENKVTKQLSHALELPLQWRVQWYDVKSHIHELENNDNTNSVLLKLAKLNFNIVQATHQNDLKEISRWWKNLCLVENLSFTRNRLVESYLWAVGVAFEPQHKSFRKWLTKAINFVLIIDDIYDIYGSLEELECFTNSVERWDDKEIQRLPECMKICFQAFYNTTNEVAHEIQKEKGWKNSILPYLHKVWADFCKALLVEARWYNKSYTPTLDEYLENGLVSSSGPVLSLLAFFSVMEESTREELVELLEKSDVLVHCTSMIIRLCNDLGTSAAELERGDAPSSILCFMRVANVSEEIARKKIRTSIKDTWNKINHEFITQSPFLQPFVKYTVNTARVAHFIYQHGDGFGNQDRETRAQVLSMLIEPLKIN